MIKIVNGGWASLLLSSHTQRREIESRIDDLSVNGKLLILQQ